jgi:hypothetical protein
LFVTRSEDEKTTDDEQEEEERMLRRSHHLKRKRPLLKSKLEKYRQDIRKLQGDGSQEKSEGQSNKHYLNYAQIFEPFTKYLDPITQEFSPIEQLLLDKDEDNEADYAEQTDIIKGFFKIFEPETDQNNITNASHGAVYNNLVELFQTDIEDDFENPTLDTVIIFQEQMQAKFEYHQINNQYIQNLSVFYKGHFIESIKQLVEAFANPDKPESQALLNLCGAPQIMKYSKNFHREVSGAESFGNFFKSAVNSDTSKHKFVKEFVAVAESKLDTFEGTELANRAINNYYDEVLKIIKEEDFATIVNDMVNQADFNFMIQALVRICRLNAYNPGHTISFEFNSDGKTSSHISYVSNQFLSIIFEEFQRFLQKVLDEKLEDLNAKVSREVYEDMAKYTATHILRIFNKELLHGFEVSEEGLSFDFSFVSNPIETFSNSLSLLASFLFYNFNNNLLNFVKVYIEHTLNQTGFVSLFNINMQDPSKPVTTVGNVIGLLSHIDSSLIAQQPLLYWEVVPTIEVSSLTA